MLLMLEYHVDCKATFLSPNSIKAAGHTRSTGTTEPIDSAFDNIVELLTNSKTQIYNSIELFEEYVEYDGKLLLKRQLIPKLLDHFSGDVIAFSSPGIATIVIFRTSAKM